MPRNRRVVEEDTSCSADTVSCFTSSLKSLIFSHWNGKMSHPPHSVLYTTFLIMEHASETAQTMFCARHLTTWMASVGSRAQLTARPRRRCPTPWKTTVSSFWTERYTFSDFEGVFTAVYSYNLAKMKFIEKWYLDTAQVLFPIATKPHVLLRLGLP